MLIAIVISTVCGSILGVIARPYLEDLLNRMANVWEQIKAIDW